MNEEGIKSFHSIDLIEKVVSEVEKIDRPKFFLLAGEKFGKGITDKDMKNLIFPTSPFLFLFSFVLFIIFNDFFNFLYLIFIKGYPIIPSVQIEVNEMVYIYFYGSLLLINIFFSYKSFFKFLKNKNYTKLYKVGAIVIIALFVITIIGALFIESIKGESYQILISENNYFTIPPFMYLLFIFFICIPLIYQSSRQVMLLLYYSVYIIPKWFIILQIPMDMKKIREFLSKTIQFGENDSKSICELDDDQLNLLIEWSDSRRESIKNRSIPSSIIFTFLGIKIVQFLIGKFNDLSEKFSMDSYLTIIIILLGITIILGIIVGLWIFSYQTDFIHEVCTIALYEKKLIEKDLEEQSIINKTKKGIIDKLISIFHK